MIFRMVYKYEQIFLPFCHNSHVWQNRRMDRRTEFSSLDRVCIPCSSVIIAHWITVWLSTVSLLSRRLCRLYCPGVF